jgi:NADH-quinone oxidoreductase subunit M
MPSEAIQLSTIISILGAISVIYGALLTLKQTDLKRIVAFSSVSHMGYILVGLSAFASDDKMIQKLGLSGASFQMVSHGLITGLLFYLVGIIYEKFKTREVENLGGLH